MLCTVYDKSLHTQNFLDGGSHWIQQDCVLANQVQEKGNAKRTTFDLSKLKILLWENKENKEKKRSSITSGWKNSVRVSFAHQYFSFTKGGVCFLPFFLFLFFTKLFFQIFFLITKIKRKLLFQRRNPTAELCTISKRRSRLGNCVACSSDVLVSVFHSFSLC